MDTFTPETDGFGLDLPARSATLVVTAVPGDLIFADGFESGGPYAWRSAVP